MPGNYVVNEIGKPLRAFATFVTVKGSHAYRNNGHSLLINTDTGTWKNPMLMKGKLPWVSWLEQLHMTAVSEAERRRMLGGTMDMFQIKFLIGAIMVFQHAFFLN